MRPLHLTFRQVPDIRKSGRLTEYLEIYFPYPFKYYPRSLTTFQGSVSSNYSDGTPILNGEYRILGRALKTFGEPENPQDWQFGLSNSLVVNNNSTTTNGTISATRH